MQEHTPTILGKRKHIVLVLATLLLALLRVTFIQAQATISSPQLHCIAVDSTGGGVTLTWTIPPDTNNTFVSYDIWKSVNLVGGYTKQTSVFSKTQSTVHLPGVAANASPVYFYMYTNTSLGLSSPSGDTLKSIFLNVTNLGGKAMLQWNAMHKPDLPSFNGWYKVYREYPQYVWTLIDSTQQLSLIDTIHVCKAQINYKIITDDASGCQSISNIAGGLFVNIIQPNPPVMDTVSVRPTNNINISWYPSSSTDVIGYVVYEFQTSIWVAIDTVWGYDSTFYNFTGGSPGTGSESFRIAAIDSCNNVSAQSLSQNTLYLTQASNNCMHMNTLNWNAYVHLVPGVENYKVYYSVNGSIPYKLLGTTTNTYYVDSGLNTPETICYYVQVVDSNNPNITASSNIVCYTVKLPPPAKYAYLRYATVFNNSQIQLGAYIDNHAGVKYFWVLRADSLGGKFDTIGVVNSTSPQSQYIYFTDPTGNPNLQSYTYKIILEDSCHYFFDSTNIAQTMFLTAVGTDLGLDTLKWNDYHWWQGGITQYDVYRDEDAGLPFAQIATVPYSAAGTNVYIDNVSSIIVGEGIFGYYIKASEGNNIYGLIDSSISNIAEAYQDPRVYIPNAFDPKGINKIFLPIGVFVNLQGYDFSIYNRWGQLLFEATEPGIGWDGTFHGRIAPEDVYVYRLQYTSSKGIYFDNRGTVLLLK